MPKSAMEPLRSLQIAPTCQPPITLSVSKDAIRAGVKTTFADHNFALSFAPVQVEVARSRDLAYTRGAYRVTSTDPATNRPVTANGKYVIVYRKERDLYNLTGVTP